MVDRGAGVGLPPFLLLCGTLFMAFGVASPFLPGLLQQRGLSAAQIGVVLGAGTAIRLVAGPAGCRLADRTHRHRQVLTGLTAVSAAAALGYLGTGGVAGLLAVSLLHASVLAPMVPLADAMAVAAAPGRFAYGWVRGAGSAAFVLGAAGAGQVIGFYGLGSIVFLNAGLLALAAGAAARVQDEIGGPVAVQRSGRALELLRLPGFVRLMVAAGLIQGSHALHDGFEVLRWRAAGIGPGVAGLLWSEAVLAEVAVFVLLGQPLLRRLGSRGAVLLAAIAGVVRWSVTAWTAAVPAMALVEPLHGLTFALLHLACMRVLGTIVPPRLAATAQAAYSTVAVGIVSASLSLVSGWLYGRFGAGAFWAMAGLCAAAAPVAAGLGRGGSRAAELASSTKTRG